MTHKRRRRHPARRARRIAGATCAASYAALTVGIGVSQQRAEASNETEPQPDAVVENESIGAERLVLDEPATAPAASTEPTTSLSGALPQAETVPGGPVGAVGPDDVGPDPGAVDPSSETTSGAEPVSPAATPTAPPTSKAPPTTAPPATAPPSTAAPTTTPPAVAPTTAPPATAAPTTAAPTTTAPPPPPTTAAPTTTTAPPPPPTTTIYSTGS